MIGHKETRNGAKGDVARTQVGQSGELGSREHLVLQAHGTPQRPEVKEHGETVRPQVIPAAIVASKRTLTRPASRLAGCLLAITLSSCSSTHVVTRWQDPATSHIVFTKVLSLVIGGDQSLVRAGEEDLCRQVTRVPCKPAYLAMPDSMRSDIAAAKALVRKEGFDGALVFRVVSDREKVTYVPPSYGPTFWGYYGYGYAQPYNPGYYRSDQLVRVETSIYSITQDKLLWVGTTETVNPDSLGTLVEEVSKAVRQELVREGAIPAS